MQMDMHSMMDNMQTEMEAIVNTEDGEKRKAMFATHKEKSHAMMAMMDRNCKQQVTTSSEQEIEHYGESD